MAVSIFFFFLADTAAPFNSSALRPLGDEYGWLEVCRDCGTNRFIAVGASIAALQWFVFIRHRLAKAECTITQTRFRLGSIGVGGWVVC